MITVSPAVRYALMILIAGFATACNGDRLTAADRNVIRRGNRIVAKIESFRKTERRLPHDLAEIHEDEGPLYYATFQDHYVVWFGGKRLGESVKYDSRERKWRFSD